MKQDIFLTSASKEDIPVIRKMMEDFYIFENLPFDGISAETALTGLIENETAGGVWLIRTENDIIGYLILTYGYSIEYKGKDAFVDEIFIKEKYRRMGAGKLALEFAEKTCRSTGVKALHLEVEKKNTNAQAFYRKNGYCDHDRYLLTKFL